MFIIKKPVLIAASPLSVFQVVRPPPGLGVALPDGLVEGGPGVGGLFGLPKVGVGGPIVGYAAPEGSLSCNLYVLSRGVCGVVVSALGFPLPPTEGERRSSNAGPICRRPCTASGNSCGRDLGAGGGG